MDGVIMDNRCSYCEQPNHKENEFCKYCGAELDRIDKACIQKGEPFAYNGYIVWPIKNIPMDFLEYHFYLGDRLVDVIKISRDILLNFVPQGTSEMGLVWDLFLVSQGEEEVLHIVEQNKVDPACFELKRVPTEREAYIDNLSIEDLMEAYAT